MGDEKPAGQRHIDHRHVGLQQQRARLLQPQFEVIALGRTVEIAPEQALELARGKARLFCQQARRQRLFEILFHLLDDADELRMPRPDAGRQRHALMLAVVADRRMQHRFGDADGKIRPMLAGDQGQHHVERRGAAGTGEAVAVDFEQAAGGLDFREGFREAGQVLPVDGAFIAVEQAGFGQQMRAGADRADVIARAAPSCAAS